MALFSHRFEALYGVALLLSLLVAALGASVLIRWAFDITALKNSLPHLVTMQAITTLGMVLRGWALNHPPKVKE